MQNLCLASAIKFEYAAMYIVRCCPTPSNHYYTALNLTLVELKIESNYCNIGLHHILTPFASMCLTVEPPLIVQQLSTQWMKHSPCPLEGHGLNYAWGRYLPYGWTTPPSPCVGWRLKLKSRLYADQSCHWLSGWRDATSALVTVGKGKRGKHTATCMALISSRWVSLLLGPRAMWCSIVCQRDSSHAWVQS